MSPPTLLTFSWPALLGLLLLVSGCLPSGCQRRESRALFPSDSLSRRMAEQMPVDTLRLIWESAGSAGAPLQYPRTVHFGDSGYIFVGDVEANAIREFRPSGILVRTHQATSFAYPYLAGLRGDTLLIFNPDAHRVDYMVNDHVIKNIILSGDLPARQPLQYVTASRRHIFYKVIGEDFGGYIDKINDDGDVLERIDLSGPLWRRAGMLRMWGDSLLSLSAYRPVVDILPPGGRLDTLALAGFDSPMLPRSRAFVLGSIHQPPMLSTSAAAVGDALFVLNLRPGWLRIDVFDRSGRLTHRLVQDEPAFSQDFYPIDLDVRADTTGAYELAVVFIEPEPRLALYRWSVSE